MTSEILFLSDGQYIGVPVEMYKSLIFIMTLNSSRHFGKLIVEPHKVRFAL